jgi:hypothetical protein
MSTNFEVDELGGVAKTAHKAVYGALVWFATLCASGIEHLAGADWWAYPLTVVLGGVLGTTVVYKTENKPKE